MTASEPSIKTISVLYVDDEPSLLDLGKVFLENTGEFKVDILEDANEALEILLTEKYDAIISDYQMPSMDGITFLKTLRKRKNRTPFIIFTGKGREDVVIEALNSGADFYLQKGGKPVAQFAELANMIKQCVCKKQNEVLLYRTKQNLETVLENMIDGLVITDEDGTILAVNRTTMKTIGPECECSLVGANVFDYIVTEDQEWMKANFMITISGEKHQVKPFRAIMPDGRKIWMEAISTRMRYEGQDAVLVVLRDINEKMEVEEKLRLSEQRYSSIVESQSEMICRFLPNLDVTFMNRSFVKTFEQVIDGEVRNIGELTSPSEREIFKQFLQNFTPDERVQNFCHELQLKDGAMGSVEWNVHAMFNPEGIPVEYQAVGRVKVTLKRVVNRN